MKTITTKIPNKEKKHNYILMHVETCQSLLDYLDELADWVKEDELGDWVSEVRNELNGLRKL